MLDLSNVLDLPLVWGSIIVLSIFLYTLLDGFDLGIGILFPFAPSNDCRNKMVNSIAPFWDGNETWLVLGGGGIFAAFPLAYSILMPAFYLPVIVMLIALIFRGVAFEFRFKAINKFSKFLWDYCFHGGSLVAAFCQGLMLGTFVQGINVTEHSHNGGTFDWLTPFSMMCGISVIFAYALLGSNWLILKTVDKTQEWARKCSFYLSFYVIIFIGIVSLWTPSLNEQVRARWFEYPNILYLSPIPLLVIAVFILHQHYLIKKHELAPFVLAISLYVLNFFGLAISIWPWIVPYQITLKEAAACSTSQSMLLVGAIPLLPLILCYTAYSYYVFRGKVSEKDLYHH